MNKFIFVLFLALLFSACASSEKKPDPDTNFQAPEGHPVADAAATGLNLAAGRLPGIPQSEEKYPPGKISFECQMYAKNSALFSPCGPVLVTVISAGLSEKKTFDLRGGEFEVSGLPAGFAFDVEVALKGSLATVRFPEVRVGEKKLVAFRK